MAFQVQFSGKKIWSRVETRFLMGTSPLGKKLWSRVETRFLMGTSPLKTSCQLEMKRLKQPLCSKVLVKRIPSRACRYSPVMASMGDLNLEPDLPTPYDTITNFFNCINEKIWRPLSEFISNDCFLEEFSFHKPFQGKKEVLKFYQQLMTCMGQNIEFNLESVYEADDKKVVVYWHLDWKKKPVPLTRGCSFYELSAEEGRLVIKKVRTVIESPIKPGGLALGLLKILSALFDMFPEATEWFLSNPHVILKFLLNFYHMVLWPIFVRPFLEFYTRILSYVGQFLSLVIKLLLYVSKKFHKRET